MIWKLLYKYVGNYKVIGIMFFFPTPPITKLNVYFY